MNENEIKLTKDGFRFNTKTYPPRSHYKFLMRLGRVLPDTKAQARYFVSNGLTLDVLNYDDVKVIEKLLTKHGFNGKYKYTKSKHWVRLQNPEKLIEALKLEYLK